MKAILLGTVKYEDRAGRPLLNRRARRVDVQPELLVAVLPAHLAEDDAASGKSRRTVGDRR